MNSKKTIDPQLEKKKIFDSWKVKYKLDFITPTDACKKCGKSYWTSSDENLCWRCIQCGNLIYLSLGKFTQQIQAVLQSDRKSDFVVSEDSSAVLPKKNNDIKLIKFNSDDKK